MPTARTSDCSLAIEPIHSVSALGTVIDARASRAHNSFPPSPQTASARAHRDDGYTGTNVSGKRTSCAPRDATSAATVASLSSVASRLKITGSTCAQATLTGWCMSVRRDDLVADRDLAVRENVGVQATAMREALDDARLREALEVLARLTELDADAIDVADAEALADERIEVDPAREHVAARFSARHVDPALRGERLERLGRDQGECAAGLGAVLEVVAIADEALAGVRAHAFHRRRKLLRRPDVDRLDPSHAASLPAVSAAARRLDRHHVAGAQVPRHLRRDRLPVQEIAAARAVFAAARPARRACAALTEDREPTVFEDTQLTHDAVSATMFAGAAGAEPQR